MGLPACVPSTVTSVSSLLLLTYGCDRHPHDRAHDPS